MDFDELIQKLLQTALGLSRDVFQRLYEFLIDPTSLASSISGASKSTPGPVTFFVFANIICVVEAYLVIAMSKGASLWKLRPPDYEGLTKILLKPDLQALLRLAAPLILVMAAHSVLMKGAFDLFGANVPYAFVFSAACYLGGTVYFAYAVPGAVYILLFPRLLPKLRRERDFPTRPSKKFPFWMLVAEAPLLMVICKAIHSYFVVLQLLTGISIWRAIGLWFGGTAVFMVGALILALWFWPVIFPEDLEEEIIGGGPEPDIRDGKPKNKIDGSIKESTPSERLQGTPLD